MKTKLKWKRSEEGYCDSHCGRFQVKPQWLGRTRVQYYLLIDRNAPNKSYAQYDKQSEAKAKAELIYCTE